MQKNLKKLHINNFHFKKNTLYSLCTCYVYFTSTKTKNPTYYDILNIERNAQPHEIKEAFQKLAKIYHPDTASSQTLGQNKGSEETFKQILEAYKTLGDQVKRKDYDFKLANQELANKMKNQSQSNYNGSYRDNSRNYYQARPQSGYDQYKDFQKEGFSHDDPDFFKKNRAEYIRKEEKDSFWLRLATADYMIYYVFAFALVIRWYVTSLDMEHLNKISYPEDLRGLSEDDDEEELARKSEPLRKKVEDYMNKKFLTEQQCKKMTLEQLDEMDRFGFEMPSRFKELVMEYREAYSVPAINNGPMNAIINMKLNKKEKDFNNRLRERTDSVAANNPIKKSETIETQNLIETKNNEPLSIKDTKQNEIHVTNPTKTIENEDVNTSTNMNIPRMRANLYEYGKSRIQCQNKINTRSYVFFYLI